ncbi:MAG: ATP cone domain-containing protein [Pyrobaculum sp.]|jgi:transcriptional regulator NrdR family protein
MVKVIKRDGREEEFIPEKIVVSVLKAGAPVDVARRIAKKVECMVMERENVTAKELTRYILAELKKVNEEWYRNWIVFDQAVKRRRTEGELK